MEITVMSSKIEVFKTDISSDKQAEMLKCALKAYFPDCRINFDLSDCDRILRIEGEIDPRIVRAAGQRMGIMIDLLPD